MADTRPLLLKMVRALEPAWVEWKPNSFVNLSRVGEVEIKNGAKINLRVDGRLIKVNNAATKAQILEHLGL